MGDFFAFANYYHLTMGDSNSSNESSSDGFLRLKLIKVEDFSRDVKEALNGHLEPIAAVNVKETEDSPGILFVTIQLQKVWFSKLAE